MLFMKDKVILFSGCIVSLGLLAGCTKAGTGGKATINGHVKHHEVSIPGSMVYLKYGAVEFPGNDVNSYDESTLASSGDGHYEFEELKKGNYYIYGVGYDSTISAGVVGGIPIKVKNKTESIEINVPVTE